MNRPTNSDPYWYKDAVIYELHVRAFHDANGDGIGDFAGLTAKLDYLQQLGVTALWLLPFYPSPLRDDGYDIADYTDIHSSYGTMRDFKRFLREAHSRDLRVITELVINHTSVEHPWFQRARRSPKGSAYRDFYVWTDDPGKYRDARIIFRDFETSNWTWDPQAQSYYWHRFYSHQPDLNFENPKVEQAVFKVLDFWLSMGVDGLRLDAVPYLHEADGTNCENLPATHAFLKRLRAHIDANYEGRMLLAEANQWPEDAAAYFGDGDECHMNFHFPLMPRLFMALHHEDSRSIVDILEHTPQVHESCQWAIFLRNHDELTLEMVTDEDRDYMYRVYANDPRARINLGIRRRLAPLLQSRRKIELMNGLLFSLPGTPVLYYGDELGMGDNVFLGDRNGVRTPMQWSGDRNAGFSPANPQMLYLPAITDPEYHYESVNVEAQSKNPSSLLSWMKRLIRLRRTNPVFGRGTLEFIESHNPRVLAFVREYQGTQVLVVANLSRFMQYCELELGRFAGMVPMEVFGHNAFPAIGESAYFLSLSPHGFCWFFLRTMRSLKAAAKSAPFSATGTWRDVFVGLREAFEALLAEYLVERRWFRSKGRELRSVGIIDTIGILGSDAELTIIEARYKDQEPERYVLPLAFATGEKAQMLREQYAGFVITDLVVETATAKREGVIYDAAAESQFATALLQAIRARATLPGNGGQLAGVALRRLRRLTPGEIDELPVNVSRAEQSNTSIFFGKRFIMKIFRELEEGLNPDVEIGRFLEERRAFAATPSLLGYAEYHARSKPDAAVVMVQELVENEGDGWAHALEALRHYIDRALKKKQPPTASLRSDAAVLERARGGIPAAAVKLLGDYASRTETLGRRTAEMHLALASDRDHPDFWPEDFNLMHQRSLYEGARMRLNETFRLLDRRLDALPPPAAARARNVLDRKKAIDQRLRRIVDQRLAAQRIRCHGDYHLGQVLATPTDFFIIDFEGEPALPLNERRFKRSPLIDVAGMLRSFHYVTVAALRDPRLKKADRKAAEPWLSVWHSWVTALYLKSYLGALGTSPLLPEQDEQLSMLLDFFIMNKCIYEVGYEVNNRPDWLTIPLEGLSTLLG